MSIFKFRRGRTLALSVGMLTAGAVSAVGCLNPPVVEQQPNTSNVFVQQIINTSITAIDLLFVIDNSVSMGDKQAILENAVPQMVERLLVPDCVELDALGNELDRQPGPSLDSETGCPTGYETEFTPVNDIHVGVITSSLGAHGAESCLADQQNDASILVPNVRSSLPDGSPVAPTVDNVGFLAWQPTDGRGSEAEKDQLKSDFANHVVAAGESGCGFEAPLEAWYRFLVDANPPGPMQISTGPATFSMIDGSGETFDVPNQGQSYADTRADEILTQRANFLRQESLVAIVVLTDENDCSAMDGGEYYGNSRFGWFLGNLQSSQPFSNASATCETNPNDICCYSCLLPKEQVAAECQANYDASCPANPPMDPQKDQPNARCVKNKQRFGLDLLYPTQRYVDGLTKIEVVDHQTGKLVPNPLLAGFARTLSDGTVEEAIRRPDDFVFFAGIVGIPWQDLATEATRDAPNQLEFLNADALVSDEVEVDGVRRSRWDVILGTANLAADSATCRAALQADGTYDNARCGVAPVPPLDPFMVESFAQRAGTNPITGDVIVPDFGNPEATINGHEFANTVGGIDNNDDLQYSCIFELEDSKDCTLDENAQSCDCTENDTDRNRPLCEPPSGGAAGTTQYYAKAYPATRVLQVLKDFGGNSIVGSICPKVTSGDPLAPGFGYNPAVKAIVDRLKEKLGGACLPRELTIDEDTGEVPCTVVEAKVDDAARPEANLNCQAVGRGEVSPEIRTAVEQQLADNSLCGDGATPCSLWRMCEIQQLIDEPGEDAGVGSNCFFEGDEYYNGGPGDGVEAGYCYIDPAKGPSAGGRGTDCSASSPENCSNPNVLQCPAASRRQLRFVGVNTPAENSVTFVACVGESGGGGFIPDVEGGGSSPGGSGSE